MPLLLRVVEIKVEIHDHPSRVETTILENIFDDRGAQYGLTASRDTM
jgi:hypothetical protein